MKHGPYLRGRHGSSREFHSSNHAANGYFQRLLLCGPDENHPTWVLCSSVGDVQAFVASRRQVFRYEKRGVSLAYESLRIRHLATDTASNTKNDQLGLLLCAHLRHLAEAPAYSSVALVDVLVGDWNPPVSVFEFEELGFKSSGLHTGERAHLYIAMGTLRQAARLARGRTRRR